MERLAEQKCEECHASSTPATDEEIVQFRPQIPDWEIRTIDGIARLSRTYRLRNFAEALEFTYRIGTLAETEWHHPAILTEWGKVTVQWWTRKIKGLHRNDFIMAAKTDALIPQHEK